MAPKFVAFFYQSSNDMEQFAFHVQRRLVKMPSTVNYFHSTLAKRSYTWFHPKTLFGRDGPVHDEVARLGVEFNAPFNLLWADVDVFLKFAPYALQPSAPIRLLSGAPNSPFSVFLKHALQHHAPQVVRSLRHGSDKITAPSFLVAFWISQFAVKPYFTVRVNCCFPFSVCLISHKAFR
jgi:hypothetical protein